MTAVGLLAEGSPTWLIGPLGALLLVAGELSALNWECQGRRAMAGALWARLRHIASLAALGLVGGLAVGVVATGPVMGGTTLAFVLAMVALVLLARVVLRATGRAGADSIRYRSLRE